MINRDLLYYDTFETFNSLKLSANQFNTHYTLGVAGEEQEGEPLIAWKTAVFIDDTRQIWIRGKLWDVAAYDAYGLRYTLTESVGDAIDRLVNQLDNKQDKLVSGETIKTIGGNHIIGSGDIPIKTIDSLSIFGIGNISTGSNLDKISYEDYVRIRNEGTLQNRLYTIYKNGVLQRVYIGETLVMRKKIDGEAATNISAFPIVFPIIFP